MQIVPHYYVQLSLLGGDCCATRFNNSQVPVNWHRQWAVGRQKGNERGKNRAGSRKVVDVLRVASGWLLVAVTPLIYYANLDLPSQIYTDLYQQKKL